MSEPGPHTLTAAARRESLWDKAPGWRNLVAVASLLTLAAVATPMLLPGPVDQISSPPAALPHMMASSTPTPNAVMVQPVNPATQMPALAHQTPAKISPSATSIKQHNPAAAPDLSNLPAGTIIVSSGELARVNRHNRFKQSLGADLPISITVLSQPAHGVISTQQGTAPLTFPSVGTRMSNVTDVMYQSNSGYVGPDSFTYKRTSPDPTDPRNANVYTMHLYVK